MSKNCGFCNKCYPGLIRDRIVPGISDENIRKKLLSESKLTLKKAEEICRSYEKANEGAKLLTQENQSVNYITRSYPQRQSTNAHTNNKQHHFKNSNVYNNQSPCKFCSKKHKFGRQFCPAFVKTC